MYNDQRRGDSWKLNALSGHCSSSITPERESKATSRPLAVEGFSRQSVKTKLQKMQKVLGNDVINFSTSSTDVEELIAIRQSMHAAYPALIQPYNTDPWLAGCR